MKTRSLLTLALSLVMLVSLIACGQSAQSAYPGTTDADTVVLDITAEPMEMNSMLAYDSIAMDIISHCVSGITKLDENDQPVADLAEKWEVSEDNRTYTIYLRKDATWSNGEPVTAKDFYFSWVTQLNPETGTYFVAYLYDNIKNGEAYYNGEAEESELGIEVIDDYTLKIEWERPKPESEGLFLLARPMYFPVNQKAYEEIGADAYAKEADQLVTNGAYKLTEWAHDDHMTLEKSEDYYDAANIHIPKVKLMMIGDASTRLNAFMTGEIDMSNLYSDQIAQIQEKDPNAIHSYLDGGTWYFGFNLDNEYLSNINLRKALAYSVDVQSLLDNIIADGSTAANGLVPGTIAGVGDKTYAEARGDLFGYDLDKAKEHLALALQELGVGADEIQLTLDVGNTTYSQNQAAYIQQEWSKNLGIEVTVNAQAWNALQEAKWNGDYNISVEANGASENTAMSFLSSFTSNKNENVVRFDNSEYNSLIESANNESDPAKKQDLMIQAETLLLDEMAVGPLYYTCTTYALSSKVENLVRTPFQYFNVKEGATLNAG